MNMNANKLKTVFRVHHNAKNRFVQLLNSSIWDEKLSLRAVGLWARCLSKPDDWHFSIEYLISHCKEGRDAIYAAIKELIENGYVIRIDFCANKENGKFTSARRGMEYIFLEERIDPSESKQYEEYLKNKFRHPDFQDGGKEYAGDQPLLIPIAKEQQKQRGNQESACAREALSVDKSTPPLPLPPSDQLPERQAKLQAKGLGLSPTTTLSERPAQESKRPIEQALIERYRFDEEGCLGLSATTAAAHAKLVQDFGAEVVEKAYEKLAIWKAGLSAQKRTKENASPTDHLKLRKWAIEAAQRTIKPKKALKYSGEPVKPKPDVPPKNVDKIAENVVESPLIKITQALYEYMRDNLKFSQSDLECFVIGDKLEESANWVWLSAMNSRRISPPINAEQVYAMCMKPWIDR